MTLKVSSATGTVAHLP